jgi:hypothetical protein
MLGHVFIVSDAKDLAQIVRDVTRYGGSFRPEVRVCLGRLRKQGSQRVYSDYQGCLRVYPEAERLEEN